MNFAFGTSPVFTTTHWSVVMAARQQGSEKADEALEKLCRTYWYPLYVFLRRTGCTAHDAEDLTQAFFERVLERDYLHAVDRSRGKFRSFLLTTLQHFTANHRRDARAQKRGGGCRLISLDDDSAEKRYLQSAFADVSPTQSFERQWAMTLLEQVVHRLRDEFVAEGKAALFEELKIFLTGDKRVGGYARLAMELATTEAALKMAVRRMRQRYGELLRAEIAITVSGPAEVEEELRALFAALS
jgi:DNA-directed RNA polymerase specialized sigma24 family protein